MDFKEWKQRNQDPLQYWLSKLSKEQLSLLDKLKSRFNWRVDGFSQIKRDELQIKIDNHFPRAKIEFLERCHAEIVNKTEFLESYRDILGKETYAINENKFNAFVKSFEVVGLSSPYINDLAEVNAMEYLEAIATLNILEYLRNEIIDNEITGNSRFKDAPEWQRVLAKLANRFNYPAKTVKFTIIFHFMKKLELFPIGFKQLDFMQFVRKTYLNDNGFTKMDFPENQYLKKVTPHECELTNFL
jgi:hypothetical protein